jgi:hypothetical protein
MKTHLTSNMMNKLYITLCILILIFGCDKAINITQPTIIINSNLIEINDTLEVSVIEFAEIDGSRIEPDYYVWEIVDKDQVVYYSDFPDSPSIIWIPDSPGNFFIRLRLGYDGNKSITLFEEITVSESPESLQKNLIGKWRGEAETKYGLNWKVTLTFDSIGHYIGKAEEISDSSYWPIGPFHHGYYLTDNWESVTWLPAPDPIEAPGSPLYRQIPHQPSEDIPCTLFEILEVKDNKGFGELAIGFEYEIWGNPYHYDCSNYYTIGNLVFSNGMNDLYFNLVDPYDENSDWEIEYNLIRIL